MGRRVSAAQAVADPLTWQAAELACCVAPLAEEEQVALGACLDVVITAAYDEAAAEVAAAARTRRKAVMRSPAPVVVLRASPVVAGRAVA